MSVCFLKPAWAKSSDIFEESLIAQIMISKTRSDPIPGERKINQSHKNTIKLYVETHWEAGVHFVWNISKCILNFLTCKRR